MSRLHILRNSWSTVAKGYRLELVPRFRPWVKDVVDIFVQHNPPDGLIFVAGCGTGDEIVHLASRLPRHKFLGVDLADGMIEIASHVVEQNGLSERVRLRVGDASYVPEDAQPCAAVFSCFTLQQMPRPDETLANWVKAVAPGGIVAVCFWPKNIESPSGPWSRLMKLDFREGQPNKSAQEQNSSTMKDWESQLVGMVSGDGGAVVVDRRISHDMNWPSADAFWEIMTRVGPWHARRLQFGDEEMERRKAQFMKDESFPAPLHHTPEARMMVIRRLQSHSLL